MLITLGLLTNTIPDSHHRLLTGMLAVFMGSKGNLKLAVWYAWLQCMRMSQMSDQWLHRDLFSHPEKFP